MGPCRNTSLSKAASSPWRANLSSKCASFAPVKATRRRYFNTESSDFLDMAALVAPSYPYRGADGRFVFNFFGRIWRRWRESGLMTNGEPFHGWKSTRLPWRGHKAMPILMGVVQAGV